MTLESSRDVKSIIFSSIREKIGNTPIHLELTPNRRARLTIKSHRICKDFINRRDALQWLIHTYNVKHLSRLLENCHQQEVATNSAVNKTNIINDAAREIYDNIVELEFFTTESFRRIVDHFGVLKDKKALNNDEMEKVYAIVMESLKIVLDETMDHRQHDVYQKYLDQLRIKGYRKF
jgi:hypothetical protein